MPLFTVKPVDRAFYEKHLAAFLPDRMIDMHTHVWLKWFTSRRQPAVRRVSWPDRVAAENTVEQLIETYALMFPGKSVTPLLFTTLVDDYEVANAYVERAAKAHNFPALIFSRPQWNAAELEKKVVAGSFLGIKSYLTLAEPYLPENEIRIFDFFPHQQLEVLNAHGWILMLHIPRPLRLRDPVNHAQLLLLEERYPRIKIIVAHVGRAYCPEDIGNAFKVLGKTRKMSFDISANTNRFVFRKLIEAIGPRRILFGSDLPITRMRMRRICERGNYVNLVPSGLYGDVSQDPHLRAVRGAAAQRLTFFMYEELNAFRRAAAETGLSRRDLEDVFHNNAAALLSGASSKPALPQLQMTWSVERLKRLPAVVVPGSYKLRTYRPGDEKAYIALMREAGFETWGEAQLKLILSAALPDGLFFLIHRITGQLAATAAALHNPTPEHPFGGELGWLAAHPRHRGKGLGAVVCAAVIRRLRQAQYRRIYLLTDDWRLPAIKTYLRQGWQPRVDNAEMRRRWQAVCQKLAVAFNTLKTVSG